MGQLAAEYATGTIAASPCTTCYVAADHLGSTRALWDTSGLKARYDYHPFGEAIAADRNGRTGMQCAAGVTTCYNGPSSIAQRFTGQLRDEETGLDYFGLRYMSAAQGRFTSLDPNSAGASLFDPQSWNSYSYVNNRPMNYVDPDGDIPVPVITGAVGGGVGAVVGGGFEAWKQIARDGRVTNWGKVGTAAGGGFVSGGLAGLTLGFGAAAGAVATTAEVVAVNASSNVIGGYAQRRADEALGYEAVTDSATELGNVALDAVTGGAFAYAGGKLADNLFPIPNVKQQIAELRFAHRRSTRLTRIRSAQRQAESEALANSLTGGISGGVPTEGVKWLWQLLIGSSSKNETKKPKRKEPIAKICYESGSCEVVE